MNSCWKTKGFNPMLNNIIKTNINGDIQMTEEETNIARERGINRLFNELSSALEKDAEAVKNIRIDPFLSYESFNDFCDQIKAIADKE